MKRAALLVALLLTLLSASALAQKLGGASAIGGTCSLSSGVQAGLPQFSQTGSTLTISGCFPGQSVLYRTDGGPVTLASVLYSAPFSVTTGEVIVAICATVGAYQTNIQASTASGVCYTLPGGSYTGPPPTTCGSSGGVSGSPANVAWTIGSTATITMTSPTTGTAIQGLFEHLFSGTKDPTPNRCDACTTEVEDIVLEASAGSSTFENIETDMPQYVPTVYAPVTTGLNRQNGVQCNQHSDDDWEVDSGNAGGWHDTGIPCSYAAGVKKELIVRVAHTNGDTGCGGSGCANYTDLWDNGTHHALGGSYGGIQGYSAQSSGERAWGQQIQPNFHSTSGTALTGTITLYSGTVAMGTGDESASQSYTAF